MASELENKIIEVLTIWGEDLVNDTKAEIDKIFSDGGGQASDLSGSVNYKVLNRNGIVTFQLTMNDYYKFVEAGRKKGARGVPIDVLSKQWQNSKNINAVTVLKEINIKAGIKSKKTIPYDKAAKTLAFLIQRSIKKKGIKPRPFLNKVLTDDRMNKLKQMLAPVIKQQFILEIKKELQ